MHYGLGASLPPRSSPSDEELPETAPFLSPEGEILETNSMTKITTNEQYEWAVKRVEELLPLVNDNTPVNSPESIELELLSGLVVDYSEEHFNIG